MKKPYSKFFWSDWRNEMTLRLCSLAARGLWMEMLSIMGISEKVGYLQIGGKPITVEQIAIMSGISKEDAEKYIAELEGNGVFSRDEYGVIYSRRMVREAIKFEEAQKNGRKGGNPKLIPESRIQNPEARSKKLEATEGIREGVKGSVKSKSNKESYVSYGEFSNVLLTDDEYNKLLAIHGKSRLDAGIDYLGNYLINNPKKKYLCHYAVLKKNSWVWDNVKNAPELKSSKIQVSYEL